jgi:hypothetical protein
MLQGLEASISYDLGHHFRGKLLIYDSMTGHRLWEADISWYEGDSYARFSNEIIHGLDQHGVAEGLTSWYFLENWFRQPENWEELFVKAAQHLSTTIIGVDFAIEKSEELGEFAWDL